MTADAIRAKLDAMEASAKKDRADAISDHGMTTATERLATVAALRIAVEEFQSVKLLTSDVADLQSEAEAARLAWKCADSALARIADAMGGTDGKA